MTALSQSASPERTREHHQTALTVLRPAMSDPPLTVVVPTRDEQENVSPLLKRLDRAGRDIPLVVLFVDDSTDETPAVIVEQAQRSSQPISLIHRPPEERHGGLGGAVATALRCARSEWVCVMDADLQHPPELVGPLLAVARTTNADVVIASRYCRGGSVGAFSATRMALSRSSALAARALFPRRLRGVSDPLSGFFVVRRAAIDLRTLRPHGFKVLLDILLSGGTLTTAEVPFLFGERYAGTSKASLWEGVRYLRRLIELRAGQALSWRQRPLPQSNTAQGHSRTAESRRGAGAGRSTDRLDPRATD